MDRNLALKYDRAVPRYTSYPTAAQFQEDVGPAELEAWLAAAKDLPLVLYLHVPFCAELCWYCACHTKVVRQPEVPEDYAALLRREADLLAARLPEGSRIVALQWCGGTPLQLGYKALGGDGAARPAAFSHRRRGRRPKALTL